MAQRGGSVVTFVRYGEKVAEPIVEEGQADVIIAFERLEAMRYAHFLKKDGALVINDWRIDPMPVVIGAAKYPEGILEELKKLKKRESVIIVSAKDSIEDKVTGLDLGADDYLAKPFHLAELHARVKSVIRRHQTDGNTEIEIENLTVRPDDHTVFINGEELKLNRKEFDLLSFLAANKGKVFTKKQIYTHVWEEEYAFDDSNIMSFISKLRKKIEPDPEHPFYILTVRGVGYRFNREA